VFQPVARHIVFISSFTPQLLHSILPNCPSVSEAATLLAEGSYFQLLQGEIKALAQAMQDSVVRTENSTVLNVISRLTKGSSADPQKRRDKDAMDAVQLRLWQYSASDEFLCTQYTDIQKTAGNPVAVLMYCLIAHSSMQLQDAASFAPHGQRSANVRRASTCLNLKNTILSCDTLHCLCTLFQQHGISSVYCSNCTFSGSLPLSFAELLKNVTLLDIQGVKFQDTDDDFVLRKILSGALSAAHVNLNYTRGVSDEELFALANASRTHLTSLQLCHNSTITDCGLGYLATRCSSLQRLHVCGCGNLNGQFIPFIAAYCPELAILDSNASSMQQSCVSLLVQLAENHFLRLEMQDIDLITHLGVLPSAEDVKSYLTHQLNDRSHQLQNHLGQLSTASLNASRSSRPRSKSVVSHVSLEVPSAVVHSGAPSAAGSSSSRNADPSAPIRVSVTEANRVFENLDRVHEKAVACIEQWITLLYGPSESNLSWLGRGEFAANITSKYDAATDDYLVISEDDPEYELQFNEMLDAFQRRGLDSEQCAKEVKAVILKKRIAEKESVMAERRVVAEMERDRRTLSTMSEYVFSIHAETMIPLHSLLSSGTKRFIACRDVLHRTKTLYGA
jgi:hypothetical protein